ncbi:MAG: hypothetical protein ACTHMM_10725 [Agriterribacter sp.]
MNMLSLEITSERGTNAVLKLREQKLKNGLPFMINTKELASNQYYLEYPNGSIKLISIIPSSQNINIVRELTKDEASKLRSRFRFSLL